MAAIVCVIGMALVLSGCSSPVPYVAAFRVGFDSPEEQEFPLGPVSESASSGHIPGPSAAWADGGAYLAIITMGSGSCPSGPHSITVTGDQEIKVRLGELFPDQDPCSADISPYATVVDVPEGISADRPLTVHFSDGAVTVPAVSED